MQLNHTKSDNIIVNHTKIMCRYCNGNINTSSSNHVTEGYVFFNITYLIKLRNRKLNNKTSKNQKF